MSEEIDLGPRNDPDNRNFIDGLRVMDVAVAKGVHAPSGKEIQWQDVEECLLEDGSIRYRCNSRYGACTNTYDSIYGVTSHAKLHVPTDLKKTDKAKYVVPPGRDRVVRTPIVEEAIASAALADDPLIQTRKPSTLATPPAEPKSESPVARNPFLAPTFTDAQLQSEAEASVALDGETYTVDGDPEEPYDDDEKEQHRLYSERSKKAWEARRENEAKRIQGLIDAAVAQVRERLGQNANEPADVKELRRQVEAAIMNVHQGQKYLEKVDSDLHAVHQALSRLTVADEDTLTKARKYDQLRNILD